MQKGRDAAFWHMPGVNDLACIKAQDGPFVVVRILGKVRDRNGWHQKEVFSVFEIAQDDWLRDALGRRRCWRSVDSAERTLQFLTSKS